MGLTDDPFDYQWTKSGSLLVYRGGKLIVTVSGAKADAVRDRLGVDPERDQQILARITGNYRRGNERIAGSKRR